MKEKHTNAIDFSTMPAMIIHRPQTKLAPMSFKSFADGRCIKIMMNSTANAVNSTAELMMSN